MLVTSQIKKILENNDYNEFNLSLKSMPQEEARVFLASLDNFDKLTSKLDPIWFQSQNKNLKKWGVIYLLLHDLFHSEFYYQDLPKLEILTTAPIFNYVKEIAGKENAENLSLAYFILGVGSIKINHFLENLISEKVIIGEFISVGGLDNGVWGFRIKKELLLDVAKNIYLKTEKDNHISLIKKYKDFVFDFL